MNKFSEKILELRKDKGFSQFQLSRELKFSRSTIESWEMHRTEPSLDTLILIAKYFGVTTDYLLGLEDY